MDNANFCGLHGTGHAYVEIARMISTVNYNISASEKHYNHARSDSHIEHRRLS